MFYNVQNLFDVCESGDEYPLYTPSESNWGAHLYRRKCKNISTVLLSADADLVILAEVESRRAMEDLVRIGGFDDAYPYRYFAKSYSTTSLCVLSRYPLRKVRTYRTRIDSIDFRPFVEFQLSLNEIPLTVFAVHWPSKRHDESLRRAVARGVRRVLDECKTEEFLLVGDFNTNYDEIQRSSYEETGLQSILSTGSGMGASFRHYMLKDMLSQGDTDTQKLCNLWGEVPPQKRCSYVYRGQKNTLDHVLVPPSLCDSTGISYVRRSFRAYRMNGMLTLHGKPYSWQTTGWGASRRHRGMGYSDHYPLLFRLAY
ncbi:MAG: endonuclease/exonuclease/phosphatase family protein [Fibrobacterota bacterium]